MAKYNSDYDMIKNSKWQIGKIEDTIFGADPSKVIPSDLQKRFQEILESTKEVAKQSKPEPEIDFEPITIDRRRDLDYIEKLGGDANTLIILAELVAQGKADFLFIEYPEIRDLWHRHCSNLGKLRAKEAEIARKEELRKSALGKLTEEEKRALGFK